MGLLGKVAVKLKELKKARTARQINGLIKDTVETEATFKSDAKKLGIDIRSVISKNYYEVLGIKNTNDPNVIRHAYIGLIKKYHPDVNKEKEATKRSREINEAYAVLKDQKLKQEYDSSFAKGKNRVGQEATKTISDTLMKKYSEIRNKDIREFNQRVSTPQNRDAINAAIADVLNWNKSFNEASSSTFGRIFDYGKKLRKLNSLNKKLLKEGHSAETFDRLSINSEILKDLTESYGYIEPSIKSIMSNVKEKIQENEAKIASKLRG